MFQELVQEVEDNKYEVNFFLIIYGYTVFKEFDKAKRLIEEIIDKYKNENISREKIIWNNFILYIFDTILNYDHLKSIEILKTEYYKYFKVKTKLFDEIFEQKTIRDIKDEMNILYDKIRKEKNTWYLTGNSPLSQAIFLSKDLFYFCSLNGIYGSFFSDYIETIKKYIEILFVASKIENTDKKNNKMLSRTNELDKFSYFDFYLMLELGISDLKKYQIYMI